MGVLPRPEVALVPPHDDIFCLESQVPTGTPQVNNSPLKVPSQPILTLLLCTVMIMVFIFMSDGALSVYNAF